MLSLLIGLIFLVIILGCVWWAIQQLLPLIPMGEPFRTILRVLLVLILVLIVLYIIMILLGGAGIPINNFGIRGAYPYRG